MISEVFLAGLGVGASLGGALGVLAGRRLEFWNAHGAGVVTGRMMAEYEEGRTAQAQQARAHGHSVAEHCTPECYQRGK